MAMMRERYYEKLIVWQEAHRLCISIYQLLPQFPVEERFSLCSQLRRSAYSVPMNIVEGNIKRSKRDKVHFLEHAEGSLEELSYQVFLANELGYISEKQKDDLENHVRKVSYLLTQFRSGILKERSP